MGTDIRCRQDTAMAETGTAKSDLTCKSNPASNLLMYVICNCCLPKKSLKVNAGLHHFLTSESWYPVDFT